LPVCRHIWTERLKARFMGHGYQVTSFICARANVKAAHQGPTVYRRCLAEPQSVPQPRG
jgi:hypothetical protein